eukprot:m.2393 g.2393  ORF g.2393 m.2393 type:complete len:172 (+) comp1225_c0_seq2:116-631(+)
MSTKYLDAVHCWSFRTGCGGSEPDTQFCLPVPEAHRCLFQHRHLEAILGNQVNIGKHQLSLHIDVEHSLSNFAVPCFNEQHLYQVPLKSLTFDTLIALTVGPSLADARGTKVTMIMPSPRTVAVAVFNKGRWNPPSTTISSAGNTTSPCTRTLNPRVPARRCHVSPNTSST